VRRHGEGLSLPGAAGRVLPVPVGDARAEEDRRLLADGLFSRGLYRQAAGEYQRLVEDFPESEAYDLACFRLGESRRLSDSPVEALKAYKRVLDVPQSEYRATALFKRATIFAGIGQCDTAEELFRTLLSENPDREVRELALYYHASTLETLGSHAEAAAEPLYAHLPRKTATKENKAEESA